MSFPYERHTFAMNSIGKGMIRYPKKIPFLPTDRKTPTVDKIYDPISFMIFLVIPSG